MSAVIGETEDGELLSIGDYERRSGLYILGLPRTGKSWLMVNLMLQDIKNGHGLFFLDPHGDAIDNLINHCHSRFLLGRARFFDPQDPEYTFSINLLECRDITNPVARANTFTKAKGVFDKLWKNTFEEKPWLQLILQNTLYVFIENQGYTLAELPLFFRNNDFREFLISKMKYNRQVYDYWTRTFTAKSKHDQDEQMEAAQTRAEIMLGHPIVRDIVGQTNTTINFNKIMEERKNMLVKFSTTLSIETKKIIGTILISELLHAVQHRINCHQFCIFIDEFQNFAGFEDFPILITQAPKFGIATTIAHHERLGQLANDPQVAGATAAIANKVLFQITPHDAFDFAPEFAKEPPKEVRREPELIISQEPVADLLRRGHAHPKIQEFVHNLLRPWHDDLMGLKELIDGEKIVKTVLSDEASMYRDESQLFQLDARIEEGRYNKDYGGIKKMVNAGRNALDQALNLHAKASHQGYEIIYHHENFRDQKYRLRKLDKLFIEIQAGWFIPEYGDEYFANRLVTIIGTGFVKSEHTKLLHLYILLTYGNPKNPRSIPGYLAGTYWMQEYELLYEKNRVEYYKESHERWKIERRNRGIEVMHPEFSRDHYSVEGQIQGDMKKLRKEYWSGPIKPEYPSQLPDLPPRVLSQEQRLMIQHICRAEIEKENPTNVFPLIENFVEVCFLLMRPENHILVPASQYFVRQVNIRTEADMAGEVVRKLTGLSKYTTYTKILQEKEGTHAVWIGKIKTLKLKRLPEKIPEMTPLVKQAILNYQTWNYMKKREAIEEEIKQRQESWKASVAPPPISTTSK